MDKWSSVNDVVVDEVDWYFLFFVVEFSDEVWLSPWTKATEPNGYSSPNGYQEGAEGHGGEQGALHAHFYPAVWPFKNLIG
jgi:hypothetical protein